jgi:hypothetical protein
MYPRLVKPALAAAVTPIMKLLVVVDTLNGNRMIWSSHHLERTRADPQQPGHRAART